MKTALKIPNLNALLYLTVGWFGIEMALALDATQFQVLLDQAFSGAGTARLVLPWGGWSLPLGKAVMIGMVLSFGPLAGIIVQPLMGWLGDRLIARGVSRQFIMRQAVFYALVCTVLFTLKLSLWALVIAIALFFVSFNVLNVSYRALITETSNRKALAPQKGMVSGFVALFSGLGGFCMFMLFKLLGNSPWPAACGALVLLLTFVLVFRYAPGPRQNVGTPPVQTPGQKAAMKALVSPLHLLFYVCPLISLLPGVEYKLAVLPGQRNIFRLFLAIFFAWLGIQALRAFFILMATKELRLAYGDANLCLAVLTLVTVASALPLGKLADRLDNRLILILSLSLFALVCAAGYWLAASLASVMVMCVFLGVSFAGMIVLPLSLLFKQCPRQSEGVYSGLYNLFISMPQLYSLFITGWLADCYGYRVILPVAAITVACAVLLAFRLERNNDRHPVETA